jgi:riboflavin synthase
VAVNGVCLTAIAATSGLTFQASHETLTISSLGQLTRGDRVNIETAVKAGQAMGGHWVQGHIDARGKLVGLEKIESGHTLSVEFDPSWNKYIIYKGSIAIDGISLTVNRVERSCVWIHVLPHTYEHTNLHSLKPGSVVNLEFDLVAKYIENMMSRRAGVEVSKHEEITEEFLRKHGFYN